MECSAISCNVNTLRNTNSCTLCIYFNITFNNDNLWSISISYSRFFNSNRSNLTVSRDNIEYRISSISICNYNFWIYIIRSLISNVNTNNSLCCNIILYCCLCSVTLSWINTHNNRNFLIVKS